MKYKPYPKYKESGVAWLGEVPEHWEIVQSKRLFAQRKERAKIGEEQLTASQKYGIISQKKFMELENRQVTQVIKGGEILKHIEPNDFVISMRSFQGGLEYSKQAGAVSSAYIGLIPIKHIHSKFFTYLFKSKSYIQALQSTSNLVRDGQALRFDNFSLVDLVIIPEEEQEKLADYLEEKTQKIDTLIEKQQTLIKLLKEKRQALISHAVTKGLDDAVEMKDSGVAWIGKIPKHWDIVSLKYISKITLGKMLTPKDKGNMISKPYLKAKNLKWFNVNVNAVDKMWFTSNELKNLRLKKDDLLVSEGGEVGRTCIWNEELEECYIQNSVNRVQVLDHSPRFFLYQFFSAGQIGYFDSIVNRISIAHLTKEKLGDAKFVKAPLKEQKNIAQYLDQKTNQIDTLISKSTQAIELLKERRTALISAVVTGKVDVRDA